MKKITTLLIATIIMCVLAVGASADGETNVAKIGDAEYTTLSEAFEAVDGTATITLLDSCTTTGTLSVGDNDITLELGGYTITKSDGVINEYIMDIEGGTLTIQDTSDAKTGKIEATHASYGYGIQLTGTGSTFNMLSGTIATTKKSVTTPSSSENTTINISGGSIVCSDEAALSCYGDNPQATMSGGSMSSGKSYVIYLRGSSSSAPAIFTMTGGSLTFNNTASSAGCVLYLYQYAQAHISGDVTMTSSQHIFQIMNGSELTVDGGTYTATNTSTVPYVFYIEDGSSATIESGKFEVEGNSARVAYAIDSASITINGGTFTSTNYATIEAKGTATIDIYEGSFTATNDGVIEADGTCEISIYGGTFSAGDEFDVVLTPASGATVTIYGGTFSTDVSAYLSNVSIETSSGDGTYTYAIDPTKAEAKIGDTYYATLASAVENAGDGDTIYVIKNATTDATMRIYSDITLVVEENVTLTVDGGFLYADGGTITNNGTIDGAYGLVNYGIIDGEGTFDFDAVSTTSDGTVWMYAGFKNTVQNAQDGNTVTLFRSVAASNTYIQKSITLDLGGFTVDGGTDYSNAVFLIYDTGSTGVDTIIKNGTVIGNKQGSSIIWAYVADSVTLEELTVTNTATKNNEIDTPADEITTGGYGMWVYEGSLTVNTGCKLEGQFAGLAYYGEVADGAHLIVNGGTIGTATSIYGISGNGLEDGTDITINGGTVQGYNMAIYHPQVGDLTINGGTITGYYSGIQYSGEGAFVMNGGTVEATVDETVELYKADSDGDGGIAESGAAILFMSRGSGYQDNLDTITGEINGGTIKSAANATIIVCRLDKEGGSWIFNEAVTEVPNYLKSLTITGGTFIGGQMSIEPLAESEGVVAITGGSFLVEPDDAWIVTNYSATLTDGYYVVDVDTDATSTAVTDATSSLTEESTLSEIQDAAAALADIDNDALASDDSHIDTVNTVDQMLIDAINADESTGNLETGVSITTVDDEAITNETEIDNDDLKVSETATTEVKGLALAVVGDETIDAGTTVTVTLNIAQTAASVTQTVDEDTEETTTTIAVTYDITPYKDYSNDSSDATPVSNDEISAPITFTLHLPSIFDDTNRATLTHDGTDKGTYVVYHDGDDSYIKITTTHFSEFVVTYADKVSSGSSNIVTGVIGSVNGTTDDEEETEDEAADEADDASVFEDVSAGSWYEAYVEKAVELGIMQGYSETIFAPNDATTRAMMVTVLFNLEGQPETENDGATWYSEAQAWAVANGISDGTNMTDLITREQLVTMLYRYAISCDVDVSVGLDTNILSYIDALDISDWAMDAMQWACGAGIVDGDDNNYLLPQDSATRAQLAKVMVEYLD